MNQHDTILMLSLIGGLIGGGLCGLVPFFIGRKFNRRQVGLIGFFVCLVAGAFRGLILAIPVCIVFTVVLLILRRPKT